MATHRRNLHHRPAFPYKALALSVAMAWSSMALPNPTGAQVVSGTAGISAVGNTLTITNSAGAIINWQSFSIGNNEITRFIQPSAASAVLNRVVAGDPSILLGQLTSNGRVFLINPAGILVGAGARIDTAGLVASTLNLSNSDFLAGRLNFVSDGAGSVVNRGQIITPAGGSVYLVGANVSNEGIIRTPGGETLLAAGQSVRLVDTATPGLSVEISGAAGQATNLGEISAEAGRVGIAGALVRQAGNLSASSAVREGGKVFLKASQRAEVEGGSIDASSGSGKGGRVEITGRDVVLKGSALIDASGAAGGGQILVGGGYRGKDESVANAETTTVGAGVTLKADALENGNGGLVVAWSNEKTMAKGFFSARGGRLGGDGGVVETSAHSVDFSGARVSTASPKGKAGFWLIDPYDLSITAAEASAISTALDGGGSVIVEASSAACSGAGLSCSSNDDGNGLSDIFIKSPIFTSSGTATLTLNAEGNIQFHSDLGAAVGISGSGGLNVVLNAGKSIIGNPWGGPADIATTGSVALNATTGIGNSSNAIAINAPSVSFNNTVSGQVALHSLYSSALSVSGTNAGADGIVLFGYNGLSISSLTSAGDIHMSARSLDISGPISAPSKTVYIGPYPLGGGPNPVSVDGGETLDISSAEIGLVSAGKLIVGNDGFGNRATHLAVGGGNTTSIPAGSNVEFHSAGDIDWLSGPTSFIQGQLSLVAAGAVNLAAPISSNTDYSALSIKAGGNVALNETVIMGTGGTIDVRSSGGVSYLKRLQATAGTVSLRGDWDLSSDTLKPYGAGGVTGASGSEINVDGSSSYGGATGGGTIQLAARQVRVDGSLYARGGNSFMDSLAGNGGSIVVQGDTVSLGGVALVSAEGGKGGNYSVGANGGNGGLVHVETTGDLTLEAGAVVSASGGTPGGKGHGAGQGGTVELLANGALIVAGDGTVNAKVLSRGGECLIDCITGPAAAGGVVTLRGGSVTIGGEVNAGGSSTIYVDPVTSQGSIGGAGGSVGIAATSGSIQISPSGIVSAEGGQGTAGGTIPVGADGGAGGAVLLSGAAGVVNGGTISAAAGNGGFAGNSGTITFRSSAGGVSQSSGTLQGRVRLGDAGGWVAGDVNIGGGSFAVTAWEGIVGGSATLVSGVPMAIGAGGLRAAAITLTAPTITAAGLAGTALDTSAANGTIWITAANLGSSALPMSLKGGSGSVRLDVSNLINVRFDEAFNSNRLSVCKPSCGGVGGRTVQFATGAGFDMTVSPETSATGLAPYRVGGDHIVLNSGGNIIFSGAQSGFRDAASITLTAAGGIYGGSAATALDTSAYGGGISLVAREIGGPNQGLTINPGVGGVSARATNGGLHLALVSGDLLTSRYTLVNDAVGSNSHLTALGGNILVDGLSGFGATTVDDGLYLTASVGSIQQAAGAPLVSSGLFATAASGINLTAAGNRFGKFTALNTSSGNILLVNTGSPLVLGGGGVTGLANVKNLGGDIFIDNTGALVSSGSIEASGTVALAAHSPITLNGPVTANRVVLTAASSAAGSDNININGTVTAGSGGISASAGTDIVMAPTAALITNGSGVALAAGSNIVIGQINAGLGNVSMTATSGAVSTAVGAPAPTVIAGKLTVQATTGVQLSSIAVDVADINSTGGPISVGVWTPSSQTVTTIVATDNATATNATNTSTTTSTTTGSGTSQGLGTTGTNGGTLSGSSSGGSTIGGGAGEFAGTDASGSENKDSSGNGDKKKQGEQTANNGKQKKEGEDVKKNAQCTS
ncbi:MAG: beta strand repeat-containing protein [Actinomycetota bacterium]